MENRITELEQKVKWLTEVVAKLRQAHVSSSAHEDSFYEDETEDDRDLYDEDYYEEQREREIEEKLSDCHCGAYQLNKKGELIRVADCCC